MKILTIVLILLISSQLVLATAVTGYFTISQDIKIEDIIQENNILEFKIISNQQLPDLEVYLTFNNDKVSPTLIKAEKNSNTYSYNFDTIPSKVTINVNYSGEEIKEDVLLLNLSPKRENIIISFFRNIFSKIFK